MTEQRLSKTERFVMERWPRAKIKGAPYNPRQIDKHARKKLEAKLKSVGMLAPITVNRRTGHIVGGHQRLACIDAIEGSGDYALTVAVVELSDKAEKEANLFLNNAGAQGSWDLNALADLLKDGGVELDETGFDPMDLQVMFDETELAGMFDQAAAPAAVKADLAVLEGIDEASAEARADERQAKAAKGSEEYERNKAELKAKRVELAERESEQDDSEFYAVVVFPNREEQTAFMAAIGADPNGRYVDGKRLMAHIEGE